MTCIICYLTPAFMLCTYVCTGVTNKDNTSKPDSNTTSIVLDPKQPNISNYNIVIPGRTFANVTAAKTGAVFSFFSTSALFPLRINQMDINMENETFKMIGSSVISAGVAGIVISNLSEPINITLEINTFVSCMLLIG